ncbi:hypothetical protein PpBr36_04570 [Pyricularia pennisetigena]|uniref:hypothetical protein n=1 Tax=Pyricularia pennisetigena TaxID=1578925 RepID=UPI001153892B|nr:hypothetical protein PpBr36_04570 [Pyricularia pennisetigena]TLS27088.1 hypothetical protein PpBr36_04570 [Pyricularia pennisetigena]
MSRNLTIYRYGGRQNPFDDRGDGDAGGYGAPQPPRPPPGQFGGGPRPGGNRGPAMGRDDYSSSQNVEMASLTQNGAGFSGQGASSNSDPNFILNECRSIDDGVGQIEGNLNQLRMLQDRSLNEADAAGSQTQRQLDSLSSETMAMYRALTDRVRKVKSSPEASQARNTAQVNRVDRRLKAAINQYQQIESGFRQKSRDQLERQYRYVRPDADEREVRDAVEDAANGGGQIFQQALMQSDRRGQARAVLNAVQDRHEQMKKIEQQMIELAQLFQDMDTLIVQQDVQVAQIEQKGEEIVENLDKGNEEIVVAVETAKKTRKKKWICLGICITIVVVIAAIVAIYFLIINPPRGNNNNNNNNAAAPAATPVPTANANPKRSLGNGLPESEHVEFDGDRPIFNIYAQSKIVLTEDQLDSKTEEESSPLAHFAGKSSVQKRYVVTEDAGPSPDPTGPLGQGMSSMHSEGGKFKSSSRASEESPKSKRLALSGGKAYDIDSATLVVRATKTE